MALLDYIGSATQHVRVFPNKTARWSAVTGEPVDATAAGIILKYPAPNGDTYTRLFPWAAIDCVEYPTPLQEAEAAAKRQMTAEEAQRAEYRRVAALNAKRRAAEESASNRKAILRGAGL